MTSIFLQKLTLVVFLLGWLCTSTVLWFKGDWVIRKDFILSFLGGFICSAGAVCAIYGIVYTVLFLIS
uniref:Uncharacterized protein n=1 Tax=Klebsiella phage FKP3 TaxID=3231233 RepID=A0AAU8HZ98_9CAUD